MRLAWLVAVVAAGAGVGAAACTKANPAYCDDMTMCPGGASCDLTTNTCGPGPDAGMPDARRDCTIDDECQGVCEQDLCVDCLPGGCGMRTDGKDVCAKGVCVECATSDDCDLATPICEGNVCRTCAGDAECETLSGTPGAIGVCTGAGACVGDSDTIFVDNLDPCPTPDGSAAMPYCTIQQAVDNVIAGRNVILVRPGTGSYAAAVIQDATVVLVGQGTPSISGGATNQSRIEVSGGTADVTIRGFVLAGATSDPAAGLFCRNNATCRLQRSNVGPNAFGVYAQNADLTIERTVVHENASVGLLTTAADFTVVNNWFWGNGGSDIGAAQFGTNGAAGRRIFRNNSLLSNFRGTMAGSVGAVQCQVMTALSSNIFWQNDSPMIGALCTVDHSIIDDPVFGVMPTNSQLDPMFVSTSPITPDLHIVSGSPAIGFSEALSAPVDDFDGNARDDGAPDTGADELIP